MTDPSTGFRSLEATPEVADLRNRHRDFYRSLVAEAHEAALDGDHEVWLDLLETDLDNLRAAIEWSLATEDADAALELVAGTGTLWAQGRYNEGRQWFERSLALDGATPLRRAWALVAYAQVEAGRGDPKSAGNRASEAVEIARHAEDDVLLSSALQAAALFADRAGEMFADVADDHRSHRELADEATDAARRGGRRAQVARALRIAARLAFFSGDTPAALEHARDALAAIEGGPAYAVTSALRDHAQFLLHSGQVDAAVAEYERAAALSKRSSAHPERVVYDLLPLAGILRRHGDPDRAVELFREVRDLSSDFEDKGYFAGAATALAEIERERGGAVEAVRDHLLEVVRAVEGQAPEPSLGAQWGLADALNLLAFLAELDGDHNAARRYLEQRSRISRPHFYLRAFSLDRLADLAFRLGDHTTAKSHTVARVEELERISAPSILIAHARADLATFDGDLVGAYAHMTREFADFPAGEWDGMFLAPFALRAGDLEVARLGATRSIEAGEAGGIPAHLTLAEVELAAGNAAAAAAAARVALRGAHFFWRAAQRIALVETLGRAAVANGDAARGAALLGVAVGERQRLQYVTPPYVQVHLDAATAQARAALGDDFDAAFERGRRTPIGEAIAREAANAVSDDSD